jgi:hypothetical protein
VLDGASVGPERGAPAKTYSGRFTTLSSYVGAGYGSVSGVAELTVERRGMHSRIVVIGTAAMAGQTFNAHLHASSCAVNSGGGHYQDPGNPGVVDAVSENWPTLVCGSSGACTGGASSSCIASSGALTSGLSVVIHDTPNAASGSGSKMLCADLLPPRVYTGAFSQLASYSGAGYAGSSGVAKLEVSSTGITSRVHFMGPTASVGSNLTFGAHLHAAPCSSDGGGHYQDPANPGVVNAISENWPEVQCDSGGTCRGSALNWWSPTDAVLVSGLSIVIHDTPSATSGSGSKWMCADLVMVREYSGAFGELASYSGGANYSSSTGTAVMSVGVASVSTTTMLAPSTALANVHARSPLAHATVQSRRRRPLPQQREWTCRHGQ